MASAWMAGRDLLGMVVEFDAARRNDCFTSHPSHYFGPV
jgi:hypothetical protein